MTQNTFCYSTEAGIHNEGKDFNTKFKYSSYGECPKHEDIYQRFDLFIMKKGKKAKAQKILREVFYRLSILHAKKSQVWISGPNIFKRAIQNVEPIFELKKFRKGGTTQLRPIPCSQKRSESIAFRWILDDVRKSNKTKKTTLAISLSRIIYSSFLREGKIFQKRNEIHKLAEANRTAIR